MAIAVPDQPDPVAGFKILADGLSHVLEHGVLLLHQLGFLDLCPRWIPSHLYR